MEIQYDDTHILCRDVSDEYTLNVSVSVFLLCVCVGTGQMCFRIKQQQQWKKRLHLGLEKLDINLLTTELLK